MTHSPDRRSQSSWRSTGWTSLKYPLPAIAAATSASTGKMPGNKVFGGERNEGSAGRCALNPFYPLHKDVILACARELLILDGSIDKKTLEVTYQSASGTKEKGTKELPSEDAGEIFEILDSGDASKFPFLRHMVEQGDNPKMSRPTAEDIANEILKSTVQRDEPAAGSSHNNPSTLDVTKPPRKVSDAAVTDATSSGSTKSPSSCLLPGMLALVASGHHVSLSDMSIDQLPKLIHVSISTENRLRSTARVMAETMTSTFEERPLREFLGYRSNAKSAPKRSQLVDGIASFLFDVSHATFAFEAELAGMDRSASMSGSLDDKICGLLFDERSLRAIGGFDSSSLLPHALSIGRSRANNQSWKAFAASANGRNMLRHHGSGNSSALVGQKRRRNRPRSRSSDDQDGGKRSRSSSVASSGSTIASDENDRHVNEVTPPVEGITSTFGSVPDVVPLTISREIGSTWGVSLANEADMCIVQRVARTVPNGLRVGDMIVSAKVPEGMWVRPASWSDILTSTTSHG